METKRLLFFFFILFQSKSIQFNCAVFLARTLMLPLVVYPRSAPCLWNLTLIWFLTWKNMVYHLQKSLHGIGRDFFCKKLCLGTTGRLNLYCYISNVQKNKDMRRKKPCSKPDLYIQPMIKMFHSHNRGQNGSYLDIVLEIYVHWRDCTFKREHCNTSQL